MDYKKILEGVVGIINTTEKSDIGFANICAYIGENCPELKESEGERIRKWLIALIKSNEYGNISNVGKMPCPKPNVLAWLEKQGEQKPIWHNEDEEPQRGSLILLIMQSGNPIVAKIIEPNHTFNHGERWAYIDDLLEKQGEQKPIEENKGNHGGISTNSEWSEEDEAKLKSILFHIEDVENKDVIDWLKSIKDRVQPQQRQDWSEEDERTLTTPVRRKK